MLPSPAWPGEHSPFLSAHCLPNHQTRPVSQSTQCQRRHRVSVDEAHRQELEAWAARRPQFAVAGAHKATLWVCEEWDLQRPRVPLKIRNAQEAVAGYFGQLVAAALCGAPEGPDPAGFRPHPLLRPIPPSPPKLMPRFVGFSFSEPHPYRSERHHHLCKYPSFPQLRLRSTTRCSRFTKHVSSLDIDGLRVRGDRPATSTYPSPMHSLSWVSPTPRPRGY